MKRIIGICLLLSLLLCGCAGEQKAQKTTFCMNTVMDLQAWGPEAQEGLDRARELLSELEKTWSVTEEGSVLNTGARLPEHNALLERVEALSSRTGGAFDPKLRRLSQTWGFYNEEHRVPTAEEIREALADRQWDLGGALKGYAGQECAGLLAEMGVDRAILNLGGNIQTLGHKPDGTPWQIGIQSPEGEGYVGIVAVTGTMSVVTSGDYQRYFEAEGVRYHHILDPRTGYPADSGLRSVTVVCRDGLTADCLSTALFVMGLEEAAAFWRQSDDFEAVFLTVEGRVYATAGTVLSGCDYEVIDR